MHEIADVLGITLRHATTTHAQTIEVLERTHATLKTSLEMFSGKFRKQWLKNQPLALLIYDTTYHKSIECEHSPKFHGPVVHYKILSHKLDVKRKTGRVPSTNFTDEFLRRTEKFVKQNQKEFDAVKH